MRGVVAAAAVLVAVLIPLSSGAQDSARTSPSPSAATVEKSSLDSTTDAKGQPIATQIYSDEASFDTEKRVGAFTGRKLAALAGLAMALVATAVGLGDRVLVHGAAGGVGTAAVQLAAAAGAEFQGIAVQPMIGPDTFAGTRLGHRWEWNHNPDNSKWAVNNGLNLQTATVTGDLYKARNTLTHRIQGPTSTATIVSRGGGSGPR